MLRACRWLSGCREINIIATVSSARQRCGAFPVVDGPVAPHCTPLVGLFHSPLAGAEDTPKPTVALEYMFARRSSGSGLQDIAHVWELGGGATLADLLNVPITPQRLPSNAYVIVIDLSRVRLTRQ